MNVFKKVTENMNIILKSDLHKEVEIYTKNYIKGFIDTKRNSYFIRGEILDLKDGFLKVKDSSRIYLINIDNVVALEYDEKNVGYW